MIGVQPDGGDGYVVPTQVSGVSVPVLAVGTPGPGFPGWVIAEWEYDGNITAKASIQLGATVEPGPPYWVAGEPQGPLADPPIILGQSPEPFIITEPSPGFVNIQTGSTPQQSYIWWEVESGPAYLNYGHPGAFLQGAFAIVVTG